MSLFSDCDSIEEKIPKNIVDYIYENIKPLYEQEKSGHDWNHIQEVIKNMDYLMIELARLYSIQNDGSFSIINVYLSGIYHDISLANGGSRDTHAEDSAEIFLQDEFMKSVIPAEDMEEIAKAIRTHRASSGEQERSILGKILFQADRCFYTNKSIDVFKRSWQFHAARNPGMSYVDVSRKAIEHLIDKYGENGYAYDVLYFPIAAELFKKDMLVFIETAKAVLGDKAI